MTLRKTLSCIGFLSCLIFLGAKASETEVPVNLLGQPCLLRGPFDEKTLRMIHEIGPAQAYPNFVSPGSASMLRQASAAREKVKDLKGLPTSLDTYRDKLIKRLNAQVAFLQGLEKAKTAHDLQPLLKEAEIFIQSDQLDAFKKLGAKLYANRNGSPKYRELLDQLFDLYNDSIEPDPEPIFHRAIKRMNVQYKCSFDDGD